jgi:hypothetical protein
MATTVTPADLTVTISTQITLNGQPINSENQLVIPSINEFDKRIMTTPTGPEVPIVSLSSQVGAGTFIKGNLKYFQATNLDAVNYARIRVAKVNTYGFDIRLDPGKSFIMGNSNEYASSVGAAFVSFVDWDTISGQADTAPVDIEYVVASI